MYIPPNATELSKLTDVGQIRLGLQGLQGIGKTFAALTFPNPIVVSYDSNLTAHRGRAGVHSLDFWRDEFVNNELPKQLGLPVPYHNDTRKHKHDPSRRPNRRDILKEFLHIEGGKFTPDQTLILDSWSTIQNAFDIQKNYEPDYTKGGEVDGFKFWAEKAEYSIELMELIKTLACNVVVTVHEMFERDKDDRIIGIAPLMQGKAFKDQFSAHFSDWFRVRHIKQSDLNKTEKEILTQFPMCMKGDFCYLFQITKDDIALSIKTHLTKVPADVRFVPAHFDIFKRFE